MELNVVFEGGGIKGIGLVGAVSVLEQKGIKFSGLAGTSAGAIVASLLAAGYNSDEIRTILNETDYTKFKQKDLLDHIWPIGKTLSFLIFYGIYHADYFESWLEELLLAKNVSVFGDIKNDKGSTQKYKFQAVASDLTTKSLLILPDDLEKFGIDIDSFSVATAVRMSMSIPIFFEPYKLKDKRGKKHYIVDGGLLSNYPMWLFDRTCEKNRTIGIRFTDGVTENTKKAQGNPIHCFADYLKSILDTMLDAHDKLYIKRSNGDYSRTIFISPTVSSGGKTTDIKTTSFEISNEEAEALYENGVKSASLYMLLNGEKLEQSFGAVCPK